MKTTEQKLQELREELKKIGNWKNIELQILDSDCNNTRTYNSDGAVAVLATATNTNYLFGRITYNF